MQFSGNSFCKCTLFDRNAQCLTKFQKFKQYRSDKKLNASIKFISRHGQPYAHTLQTLVLSFFIAGFERILCRVSPFEPCSKRENSTVNEQRWATTFARVTSSTNDRPFLLRHSIYRSNRSLHFFLSFFFTYILSFWI